MLLRRSSLGRDQVDDLSRRICLHVTATSLFQQAECVGSYIGTWEEVDTRPMLVAALKTGKQVAAPRIIGKGQMDHALVSDLDSLIPGPMGIRQPGPGAEVVPPESLDLLVVPGLAFTRAGDRLGFGGGYYDTFLARCNALRVALAYGFQVLDEIPTEPHDVRVHFLATEDGLLTCAPKEEGA